MAAGKGYNHVPTSPDYPRGGRSELDWDLGGWFGSMAWPAYKQFLAILQVCWHCLAGREHGFKHSYPGDKRPEFQMWEELPNLVVFNLSTSI